MGYDHAGERGGGSGCRGRSSGTPPLPFLLIFVHGVHVVRSKGGGAMAEAKVEFVAVRHDGEL